MSTSETSGGFYRIDPLKGPENWLSFQVQIQDILTDMGYMEYVDGTNPRPSDKSLLPDWEKKDRKALVIIRLRVSPSIITYIMSATSSKEAWDTLKAVFSTQGALAKITARRKFLRYSIEEGANMEIEIRNIRMIKEELALLGTIVDDEEFALTILTALPISWDSFISSIGTTELKSSDLIGRILQEDARRQERSSEVALVARPAQTRSKFRKGVICHHCGKEGHIKPECRSRQNQQPGGNQQFGAAPTSYQRDNQTHLATSQAPEDDYAFLSIENIPEVAALIAKGGALACGYRVPKAHSRRSYAFHILHSHRSGDQRRRRVPRFGTRGRTSPIQNEDGRRPHYVEERAARARSRLQLNLPRTTHFQRTHLQRRQGAYDHQRSRTYHWSRPQSREPLSHGRQGTDHARSRRHLCDTAFVVRVALCPRTYQPETTYRDV